MAYRDHQVMTGPSKTQSSILDIAQEFSQTRGFNAFSYRDIADRIGIRAASIHHHFRTKADLGAAMTSRYREEFMREVERIEREFSDPLTRLREYAELFRGTLEAGRMCLCGTLAVEYETLPPPMQQEVRAFFTQNESWLQEVFAQLRAAGSLGGDRSPEDLATSYLSMLEGAMLSARTFGQSRRFKVALEEFLGRLED